MPEASFALSAFGDEIAVDLGEQLDLLNELKVSYLDLRSAWGVNVLYMDDDDVARARGVLADHDVKVGCIGSPIGKSPIVDPIGKELGNLARIMEIGEAFDCRRVRMFSFYPPDTGTNAGYDRYVEQSASRLVRLAELAGQKGFTLLLENEREIVGDALARCHTLITTVDSPHLRFLWDPANFVQVGEEQITERGWPLLGDYTEYVHIKDARLSDGAVTAAGEGDGQVRELLAELRSSGYQGILSLEPHLAFAGRSSGFSGESGMRYAVEALRKLMAEVGCIETAA
jgi:sugar phosphate isomerase/epimerase